MHFALGWSKIEERGRKGGERREGVDGREREERGGEGRRGEGRGEGALTG
jgi:hypothetical protein